jgi:hypothetical protein
VESFQPPPIKLVKGSIGTKKKVQVTHFRQLVPCSVPFLEQIRQDRL